MNLVCPSSWRALCIGVQGVSCSRPVLSSWTPGIGEASRPAHECIRSFYTPRQIWSAVAKAPTTRFIHTSSARGVIDSASFSTNAPNHAEAVIPPVVKSPANRIKFTKHEIASAFGKHMHLAQGNHLLQLVQEQRLAGTIDEDTPGSRGQKLKALAWLRKAYPVDEEQAIMDRLEREELAALRPKSDSIYGDSVIDQLKKHNLERQAKRDAERAKAEAEAQANLPMATTKALAEREETRAMNVAWVERYRKKAEDAGLKSVPQMSFIRRVGPATLMTLAVVSLCVMFAQNYMPPPRAARIFPNISMAAATVGALIGLNILVWLAWKWPPGWRLMLRVFMLVPSYPYLSSMVGNLFSHQMLPHLATNMAVLWFVGTKLHEDIGRGPFLALYIASGVTASQVFLVYAVLRKNWGMNTLGCSGVLSALLATWLCINHDRGIRIWPLPPDATEALQPLFLLALFIVVDLWRLRRGFGFGKSKPAVEAKIDHLSHVAGYGIGIVAAQFLKVEPRGRQQKESGKPVVEQGKEQIQMVASSSKSGL
ncbi:MAG: hypothetical protein Q9172_005930 [Xanthocarpia lactea]